VIGTLALGDVAFLGRPPSIGWASVCRTPSSQARQAHLGRRVTTTFASVFTDLVQVAVAAGTVVASTPTTTSIRRTCAGGAPQLLRRSVRSMLF
jgi:hypothetical protein